MVIEPGLGDDRDDRDDGDNIGDGTDDDVDALAIFLGTDAVVFFFGTVVFVSCSCPVASFLHPLPISQLHSLSCKRHCDFLIREHGMTCVYNIWIYNIVTFRLYDFMTLGFQPATGTCSALKVALQLHQECTR